MAAIKNFQISVVKHSSMLVSIILTILIVFDCGGEIVKVKNILLNIRPRQLIDHINDTSLVRLVIYEIEFKG